MAESTTTPEARLAQLEAERAALQAQLAETAAAAGLSEAEIRGQISATEDQIRQERAAARGVVLGKIATAEGAGDLATAKSLKASLLKGEYARTAATAEARRRLDQLTRKG